MNRVGWSLVVLTGCGVAVGSNGGALADCEGSYTGSYDGADQGVAAATLDPDGTLAVLFTSDSGEVDATGVVTEAGDVSGEEGTVAISGTFDFGDCTASGVWSSYGEPAGTWELSLQ